MSTPIAGLPAPDAQTPASEPPAATSPVETPAEGESSDDGRSDAQLGREAARYRTRLRETEGKLTEAEAARQEAADALTRQHQAIIDATATAAGCHPGLLAGHDVADFLAENGTVDMAKLGEAIHGAMVTFNVRPPRVGPAPNPQQGTPSPPPEISTWGDFLSSAVRI